MRRRCDWYDGYSDAFMSWLKSAEDDCREFINEQESAPAALGWGQELLNTTNAEGGSQFQMSHLRTRFAHRNGATEGMVLSSWICRRLRLRNSNHFAKLRCSAWGKKSCRSHARPLTQWLFNHKRYEHALSAAFESLGLSRLNGEVIDGFGSPRSDGFFNTIPRPVQKLVSLR